MFRLLAPLACLLLSSAGAQCVIAQAQLDMPDYSALLASTGMLAVRVECDAPTETTQLRLEGPGLSTSINQQLQLTVYNTSSINSTYRTQAPLILTMDQGLPLLAGLNINGTQTLRFALIAQPGQWVPIGTYSVPLSLSLRTSLP